VEWYQPATRYCGTYKAFDFSAVASQGQTKVGEQCVQGQEEKQDSQRDVQTMGGASMIEVLKLALKALNAGEHAHLIMNTDGIKDKVRQAIAELESQEHNFCPRCGKRTNDIHTCTPPQEKNNA
jgi:hypothetical protein